jgi:hypothetical protein
MEKNFTELHSDDADGTVVAQYIRLLNNREAHDFLLTMVQHHRYVRCTPLFQEPLSQG